jgi:L-alanine-DL-glutamate epimerase-like enolase superfamily enzyme
LGTVGAAPFLVNYHQLAAAEKKQLKIRDVRTMTVQGPSRTYVLVKVVADDGIYGVAEAYGTPGIGVKEQILSMKPGLVGKDPLEIDAVYTSWMST